MDNKYKYISRRVEDTMQLAQNIESEKFENMVICLRGELGTGKTVFVKGFASSLEIEENITSPTFNIVKEYTTGEMPLYHMDVYRLDETDNNIGLEEYFNKGGITIIEWSDIIKDILPNERLEIKFKFKDENTRVLILTPYGQKYEDVVNAVL